MGRMRDLGRAGVEQGSDSPAAKPVEGLCCVDRPGGYGGAGAPMYQARGDSCQFRHERCARTGRARVGVRPISAALDAGSTR